MLCSPLAAGLNTDLQHFLWSQYTPPGKGVQQFMTAEVKGPSTFQPAIKYFSSWGRQSVCQELGKRLSETEVAEHCLSVGCTFFPLSPSLFPPKKTLSLTPSSSRCQTPVVAQSSTPSTWHWKWEREVGRVAGTSGECSHFQLLMANKECLPFLSYQLQVQDLN